MRINPVVRISKRFDDGINDVLIKNGTDMFLYDMDGKKYLDFCGGIWNVPFGYDCPELLEAIQEQYKKLSFSNLCIHVADIQHNYAVRLNRVLGTKSLLYTCSGSESIEAAIKTCRKYQKMKGRQKKEIAVFNMSYHGTSYGAMSISGIDQILINDYTPMVGGINWITIPIDKTEDEEEWICILNNYFEQHGDELAGVIYEPVFGSGGIIPFPDKALKCLVELCRKYDSLLVADEVTTGFGRTGASFAFKKTGIQPDLICLSKGMTNGFMPLGAVAYSERLCQTFIDNNETLEHFSTQGGNLLAIAVADKVLDYMEDYEQYRVEEKGEYFKEYLQKLFEPFPNIKVRGRGLMVGIQFPNNSNLTRVAEIWERLYQRGLITYVFVNPNYNHGLSFFPFYTVEKEQLKKAGDLVFRVLKFYPDILN